MANIDREVMKELTSIRKMIQTAKKDLAKFAIVKDDMLDDKIDANENATCELSEEMDIGMSDLENAICEQSEMIEQALSDIENALCELTEE